MASPTTLADLFSRAEPDHAAIILPEEDKTTTFRALCEQIDGLAGKLRATHLQPGQAVALVWPNSLEYMVAFLGITRARMVAAPLNPAYKAEELRFYLEDTEAKAVIAPPGDHPVREAAASLNLPVWTAARDAQGRVQLTGVGLP